MKIIYEKNAECGDKGIFNISVLSQHLSQGTEKYHEIFQLGKLVSSRDLKPGTQIRNYNHSTRRLGQVTFADVFPPVQRPTIAHNQIYETATFIFLSRCYHGCVLLRFFHHVHVFPSDFKLEIYRVSENLHGWEQPDIKIHEL